MNGSVKPFGKVGLLKWAESAPGFNLEHVRSPLLISCLEKGTLVGSWDIYGGLRTLGKPVDLVWLRKEDAPHVSSNRIIVTSLSKKRLIGSISG